MKTVLPAILFPFACVFAEEAASPKAVERLDKLTKSYEAAVERATDPLRKTYLAELEKLRTEFTKAGDLSSALAVDARIKEMSAPAVNKRDELQVTRVEPPKSKPEDKSGATFEQIVKQLPPAPRGVTKRDIEKWLITGVWHISAEWFRLEKDGTGARYTRHLKYEPTVKWKINAEGLVEIMGAGSRKLIRMTSEAGGLGFYPSGLDGGIVGFTQEPNPPPELTGSTRKP